MLSTQLGWMQPIVLRGGAAEFGAWGKWDEEYLLQMAKESEMYNVRRTRYGDGVYHFNHVVREQFNSSLVDPGSRFSSRILGFRV